MNICEFVNVTVSMSECMFVCVCGYVCGCVCGCGCVQRSEDSSVELALSLHLYVGSEH